VTRTTSVVLWTRHGENHANVTRTLSHRVVDRELTDRGRDQARALADSLAKTRLHPEVFTSPLRRAGETTAIVAERWGLRPVVVEEFRELDVGDLDGRNDPTAWRTYDAVLSVWRSGDAEARFPGGESLAELAERLRHGLVRVAEPDGADARLVIAHGANLRSALPSLTGVVDPGHDPPLGRYATLTTTGDRVELVDWPAAYSRASRSRRYPQLCV
jgi:broad specificity phosphatase PhoE